MIELSDEMKKAGFVYRETDKNDPKYKLIEKLVKEEWIWECHKCDKQEEIS